MLEYIVAGLLGWNILLTIFVVMNERDRRKNVDSFLRIIEKGDDASDRNLTLISMLTEKVTGEKVVNPDRLAKLREKVLAHTPDCLKDEDTK